MEEMLSPVHLVYAAECFKCRTKFSFAAKLASWITSRFSALDSSAAW
jgi:hypothetical protein